ncbi:MAG: hypothetical protein D6692_04825 [Planctomycetota bacterium]|nr:MAG: hypothetical protein D6692_04825 [Planctomycetota bacterium]
MARMEHQVTLHFESYIADPYWPTLAQVIDIQKKSRMNMQRSEEKRRSALTEYLLREGLSLEEYERMVQLSSRQWYRVDNDDQTSEIIIPRHQLSAALTNAAQVSPSSVIKTAEAVNLRSVISTTDFRTGKYSADGIFSRYVKHDATNQRRYDENEYIEDFDAVGVIRYDPDRIKDKDVYALFSFMLRESAVGACRKMGYGRGEVKSIKPME